MEQPRAYTSYQLPGEEDLPGRGGLGACKLGRMVYVNKAFTSFVYSHFLTTALTET